MTIFIDPEGVFADLKRILREMQEFPAAAEVAVSKGGVSKASNDFRDAVRDAAQAMSIVTRSAVDTLNTTQQTIREVVQQLAEQDASIADETKTILALLDSASEQATASETDSENDEFR